MEGFISVRGAKEHNLKNVSVDIPRNQLVVITGVSGSGKSSLAFDTIYAEGQRRYVESLSAYARQFLELQNKPDIESITGLSPAIAIDQKTTSKNPRSTVSTATEIYDYLRLLYARIGIPYSPATGKPIEKQTSSQMVEIVKELPQDSKIYILAPIIKGQKGEHRKDFLTFKKQGYDRFRVDGILYEFDELPILDKNKKHDVEVVVDRLVIDENLGNRLADSIETGLKLSEGILFVEVVSIPEGKESNRKPGEVIVFSEKFACPISGFTLTEIEPRIFSFNSPYGACPKCDGLGSEVFFDASLIVPHPELSLKEGAIAPWHKVNYKFGTSETKFYQQTLESIAKHYGFSMFKPFKDLPPEIQEVLIYGSKEEELDFIYDDGFRTSKITQPFEGVMPYLEERVLRTESEFIREDLRKYQSSKACRTCNGYRLKQESLCVKIGGKNIGEVCKLTISDAIKWFENLENLLSSTHKQIAERALKEVRRRLGFLYDVGLEYITLNRESGTLSGGESQRIRLASQIGSGLSGVLYVLDEPSIGLHQCDNERLLSTLRNLRDLGNTVIVVEHDEDTMMCADYIVDVGLGAGIHGGKIIAAGTPLEIAHAEESITGKYLSGREFIPVPQNRRPGHPNKFIEITGARTNNLNNISASFPLGTFITVTGVSGSGKSSFTIHTLYKAAVKKLHGAKATPGEHDKITGLEYIDKIIEIDQSPIGRTPRSNPATYTGAFTPIRDWFASLPEAKIRGYKPGRFSFNVKGGRCESCEGDGVIKIEMHFLPDVYVKCEECQGARYNKETLEITYKGKSIADILNMNVEDAAIFFENVPLIYEKLAALKEVGLGYMSVGQSATTLSGGEAQRVKLAKELSRKSTGRTLYILDEPTTGLHTHDIRKLLDVLHKLVDSGNTVLVIEHNLDVIKTADYIIDIGPYGGDKGGNVVAVGTPEEVVKCEQSVTGRYLKPYLVNGRSPLNANNNI
ncbi:excinuclease ABC subunit A [endosymbiont of Acanthamoeba sp. UWC8]|uniref:excinuclease ABC subunit UvrA n=1 Tax=endosymbiont of Acanthamoeba sp. UWC8 TaxID=86106 RepID=UPI0004D0FAFE|nr:excinuclease ABC subunit UvrA [endosymbiont of Acanthamoeba sp. UWC8]AIF81490.1 excinuclease ABC subunit A [endosymbiont of Acanthamoeba sp. UWC8]